MLVPCHFHHGINRLMLYFCTNICYSKRRMTRTRTVVVAAPAAIVRVVPQQQGQNKQQQKSMTQL
jgi:hypothetical protein